jgi:hypothetical protein
MKKIRGLLSLMLARLLARARALSLSESERASEREFIRNDTPQMLAITQCGWIEFADSVFPLRG